MLNIGDMRVMEVYVYVYNPYLWMILYFTITMGINGCILDFTTKCAQMICLLDFTTIMRLSFYHIFEFYILPQLCESMMCFRF